MVDPRRQPLNAVIQDFAPAVRVRPPRSHLTPLLIMLIACSVVPTFAQTVLFENPVGGWFYSYGGAATAFGTNLGGDSLDGTWLRGGGSDSWDGSGLGGVFSDGLNNPGGLQAFVEGGTDFIRIQDTGDPRAQSAVLGYTATDPSNRKLYFTHALTLQPNAMDTGITLAFRLRIATSGLLDNQYPATAGTAENPAVAGGTPWQAAGNGMINSDDGKGFFGFRQGGNDTIISFSPAVPTDQFSDGTGFGQSALTMNNLNGATRTNIVDPFNLEAGTRNALPVVDWSQWHEFWITIFGTSGGPGTHEVDIYTDGSLLPAKFDVTAGIGDEGIGAVTYLAMGVSSTSQQAAIDVDYVAIRDGVIAPVPEPTTPAMVLLGTTILALSRRAFLRTSLESSSLGRF